MSEQLASQYRRFAETEARGHSPLYEALALGVAEDGFALDFLQELPEEKRQPNLLLAVLRHVCGIPLDWPHARELLRNNADSVRSTMLARRTQTNEAGRCAALLPVLSRLPQPLALIEVGASAGLCLLPDRYGYDYGRGRLPVPVIEAPSFGCRVDEATPLPAVHPVVVWRRGLDLYPVDLSNAEQCRWLETLVWPEETDRLHRLRAAMAVARQEAPMVVQGDLLSDLPAIAAEAPANATLVVFHSATLAYVPDVAARQGFIDAVRALGAVWISNEMAGVFPAIRKRASRPGPRGAFLVSVNGVPVAWTHPHGRWVEWIGEKAE